MGDTGGTRGGSGLGEGVAKPVAFSETWGSLRLHLLEIEAPELGMQAVSHGKSLRMQEPA